jgi:hypothetical protein
MSFNFIGTISQFNTTTSTISLQEIVSFGILDTIIFIIAVFFTINYFKKNWNVFFY